MELDQLIPEKATWERTVHGANGESRTLKLVFREFDLEDEAWLKRAFGDELQKHFEQMNMEVISRIAFHQLDVECKKELMNLKFIGWDEEKDEEIEIAKTGREKLGKLCVGFPDQMELLKILLKVRGFSMPVLDEIIERDGENLGNELKETVKKTKAQKKK